MTSPVPAWLPERHLGVVATLAHADEVISQVGNLLFEYLAHPGEVIGIREVLNGAVSNATVERIAPIPRKVPLLVADVLVTLRAAVEHTLFTEVEFLNDEPLEEKAARSIEMPASLTHSDYVEWLKKGKRNVPAVMGAGSELLRRVEGLQPFHRNISPHLHPLARLALQTNNSKHRTPATIAVRLVTIIRDDKVPRSIYDVELRPEQPLLVGDVIAQTPLGQHILVDLFPTLVVNRPGTDEWPILMHELEDISRWVREQAIPKLITGVDQSAEPLPTRYQIDVGHEDELQAMSMGSSLSAAELNKVQLGAAIARPNLVDLLLPISEVLTREGLTVWTEQLSDADVIARVQRLKPSFDDEPSLLADNLAVLDELSEEAIQFMTDRHPFNKPVQ